ncbi:uncharacterized protein B0H18DRAFT_1125064 [Fomitopsis serialis]|uniref:uncharacterized protein n=1 Tax=Fomitopsis serialis TaxID=139415 RepID=UPI0020088E95|nr:uncharacterized protein B0H18DRAFT_1125064 [Neoantrodia serialis]KAH9915098.1 hypothetical protein B0H18DRAFT_1125064 [Neoantrodia serialis]
MSTNSTPINFVFRDGHRTSGTQSGSVAEPSGCCLCGQSFQAARQPRRTDKDKLNIMLRVLGQLSWTLGDFLYNLFRSKDDNGEKIQRDEPQRTMIARFLSGNTKHTFAKIVHAVMEDTAGLPKPSDDESAYMYSRNHPSLEIKHARPALTTMAVELVIKEMVREMNATVKIGPGTGHTPSWSTVIATLKRLADSAREELREMGKSETQALVMRMDNVQKYRKQREQRIGRRNEMDVGLAATVAEARDFTADALDLGDKLRRIAENERSTLTVPKLLNMIDLDHYDTVSALQWLQTLVYSIPQLDCHKSALEKLNKTEGAKLRVPKQKTALHPLATTRKNENIMTELRDALVDFMEQVGQDEENYQQRLLFIGGDGLTFERLQQIKQYLDDQTTAYRRFDIIMPFLEIWHTIWTHLSSVFETHWGNELTKDPSKLGHSAHKIGQKTPSNLKKVDYYAASHLLYIVLDTRMLDCWR